MMRIFWIDVQEWQISSVSAQVFVRVLGLGH